MTDIEICSMALANIGVTPTSTVSLSAPVTKEDRECVRFYAVARKKLLGMADWPFARRHAILTEDTAFDDPEFSYVYALPSDYLKARRLEPVRFESSTKKQTYRIGLKSDGVSLRLFCDVAPVAATAPVLTYTADISVGTTPAVYAGLYPAEFADALAWDLAARIGSPLRADPKTVVLARKMAQLTLEEAYSLLANEGHEDPPPDADHILARG